MNSFEKLWKLEASVNTLVLNGKRDPGEVAKVLQKIVDGQQISYLKCISTGKEIILDPTDGTEMIGKAKDVFKAYIDSNFQGWNLNVTSAATNKTKVQVYETVKNGTFAEILSSPGEVLERLCLTQAQILGFCKKHESKLRNNGGGTFFLFKKDNDFFVVDVYRTHSGLNVQVFCLLSNEVWSADRKHRVVVPQL